MTNLTPEYLEIEQRRFDLEKRLTGLYLREKDGEKRTQIMLVMDALGPKLDLRELAKELNVR